MVRSFDADNRAKLLNFWIGTTRVPAGGFANTSPRVTLQILSPKKTQSSNDRLPVSHICFNRFDMPAYESEEQMKQKLLVAIEMTGNAIQLV